MIRGDDEYRYNLEKKTVIVGAYLTKGKEGVVKLTAFPNFVCIIFK